jgi:hypothetical protein
MGPGATIPASTDRGGSVIGDLFYSLGSWVGGLSATDDATPVPDPAATRGGPAESEPVAASDGPSGGDPAEDNGLLVNAVLGATAAWVIRKQLRPRSVSWPRVVVAGIGATVLSDLVGMALEPGRASRDRVYETDPDAVLIRLAAGVAVTAGYAALLYPRLPGPPLARGLAFSALEIAAAPRGGLVRVATDAPGLKFPLKDLAVPMDDGAGPLSSLAFGLALGALYQPPEAGRDEG